MTVAAKPGERVFNIPAASDSQAKALTGLRSSMADVLDAMDGGAGCKNGKTTFFAQAEQFQRLWNSTLDVFASLLLPQFKGVPSAVAMLTEGISKDGKWGPQMAWCCAVIEAWQRNGVQNPPARACQVALWTASYPEASDMLRIRVTNSLGESPEPSPDTEPAPDEPEPPQQSQPQQQQAPVQQHQFQDQQVQTVLGTKAGSGMPWWSWGLIGAAALGSGYLAWRYMR